MAVITDPFNPTDPSNPFAGMTGAQFLRWLHAQPPEFKEGLHREIWLYHPEMVLLAVKRMRELATDPHVSRRLRAEANRALRKHGYDDESLRAGEPS